MTESVSPQLIYEFDYSLSLWDDLVTLRDHTGIILFQTCTAEDDWPIVDCGIIADGAQLRNWLLPQLLEFDTNMKSMLVAVSSHLTDSECKMIQESLIPLSLSKLVFIPVHEYAIMLHEMNHVVPDYAILHQTGKRIAWFALRTPTSTALLIELRGEFRPNDFISSIQIYKN